jgi:hypothetical protein
MEGIDMKLKHNDKVHVKYSNPRLGENIDTHGLVKGDANNGWVSVYMPRLLKASVFPVKNVHKVIKGGK